MYDVVTWQAQRRRVAVRLHVEIHTHVEGVSAHEGGRGELGAELGVTWWQQSREWVQVHEEVKKKKKSLTGQELTLWVGPVFEGLGLSPPLQGEVSHFCSALTQQDTAATGQNLLQLDNTRTWGQEFFRCLCMSKKKKNLWNISDYRPRTHTSSSSLPSFRPHCSAGEPDLTWLTKIPVRFPPTMVMSSARLAFPGLGEVQGLEDGDRGERFEKTRKKN